MERINQAFEKLSTSGFPPTRKDLLLFTWHPEEYRRDPSSVPPEWRQLLDDLIRLQKLSPGYHSSLNNRAYEQSIRSKDDEAFRFFLDEPDLEN
jgi:hypothetical protein